MRTLHRHSKHDNDNDNDNDNEEFDWSVKMRRPQAIVLRPPASHRCYHELMERGCIVTADQGRVLTVPDRVRKTPKGTEETVSCQKVARIVGREFARIGDRVTIYTTFGIRP